MSPLWWRRRLRLLPERPIISGIRVFSGHSSDVRHKVGAHGNHLHIYLTKRYVAFYVHARFCIHWSKPRSRQQQIPRKIRRVWNDEWWDLLRFQCNGNIWTTTKRNLYTYVVLRVVNDSIKMQGYKQNRVYIMINISIIIMIIT